jgi:hypothetical protein
MLEPDQEGSILNLPPVPRAMNGLVGHRGIIGVKFFNVTTHGSPSSYHDH